MLTDEQVTAMLREADNASNCAGYGSFDLRDSVVALADERERLLAGLRWMVDKLDEGTALDCLSVGEKLLEGYDCRKGVKP